MCLSYIRSVITVKLDSQYLGDALPLHRLHSENLQNIPLLRFLEVFGLVENAFHVEPVYKMSNQMEIRRLPLFQLRHEPR